MMPRRGLGARLSRRRAHRCIFLLIAAGARRLAHEPGRAPRHVSQSMYSGVYGTEMRAQIFIGLVYYQRLRHMVSDKHQANPNP